jgi:hypothetical protein
MRFVFDEICDAIVSKWSPRVTDASFFSDRDEDEDNLEFYLYPVDGDYAMQLGMVAYDSYRIGFGRWRRKRVNGEFLDKEFLGSDVWVLGDPEFRSSLVIERVDLWFSNILGEEC